MHCGDAEVLAIIGKQVTEFCLTEAARVGQNSLEDGLKVAWRTGDCAEHLGGRRLLLQRLGKVPPHLGELTGARFELLFQLARRIGPVANARFRLRSGRTKLVAGRRSTICTFARQGRIEVFMATDLAGILIVDDNEDNRYTLQLMLESDGHERITCAAGGNEAIALIAKEKFSLVLLDLMMPDLNGDAVLKTIKSDPDQRDMPVVMISADTNADKVSQCIELGADDYLPKPFNPTILRARIGAALRRHSLRALENEYLGKIENEKRHSENLLRNIL